MSNSRGHRRPALIALVAASALTCLALGWWQWERFEAVGGNGQNLGYAFQWPLFAIFVVYAYRRFVRLEAEEADQQPPESEQPREVPLDLLPRHEAPTVLDDADDTESRQLLEYNSYLAELNDPRETDRSTT